MMAWFCGVGVVCFACLFYSEDCFRPDDVSVIVMALFRAACLAWVALSLKGKSAASLFFLSSASKAVQDAAGRWVNQCFAAT